MTQARDLLAAELEAAGKEDAAEVLRMGLSNIVDLGVATTAIEKALSLPTFTQGVEAAAKVAEAVRVSIAFLKRGPGGTNNASVERWAQLADQVAAELVRADDLLRSLTPSGDPWKDIGSAPRDGTDMLLYFPLDGLSETHPRTIIGHWHDGKGINSPGFWVFQARATRGYSDNFQPTHWLPLPPPPASPTASSEDENG